MKNEALIEKFWKDYLLSGAENLDTTELNFQAWHFMTDNPKDATFANELAELVRIGEKTATAILASVYDDNKIPYPAIGSLHMITTFEGIPVCIVRATKITAVPYAEVSEEHAYKEGEGDRSLETWRNIHEVFFSDLLRLSGKQLTPETLVLCVEFECIYTNSVD